MFEDIVVEDLPDLGKENSQPSSESAELHTGLTQRGTHQDTL